ncbi:MAG: mannosyl-3-phosphoglycerate phosphatase [Methanosarcinaceae archaeon]|nr:mannosyl-3-phosphoglycerate phosphatase [Methanosarcinaceae archaeon]
MQSIVFTDLDGTLIDHNTYSYDAARPALEALKGNNIPLIFCTSKTRAEIEIYVKELDINHPFISENGGAIFIPRGYFEFEFDHTRDLGRYMVIEMGTAYETLRTALMKIRRFTGFNIIGFGDLDDEEVSTDTGLDIDSARLARMREYDEAFRLEENKDAANELVKQIHSHGLNYTRGGRYWHLIGDNDKGKAVRILSELYHTKFGNIKTIGLGDSLNDLPMLRSVDVPLLVQKSNGKHDPSITDTGIDRVEGVGPIGWNSTILRLINGEN